ncbi:MAG: Jag N-terminal domain-containing protein [Acidobacteria bacterium]|nr:Jag N-terminal domain-containing protein [Acidobacteriota bacterium]
MKRFEGKNLEEALDAAAAALGVERFRIKYNVVSEKRGFLGGVKRVVIEASVRSESDPAPVEPESPPSEKAKAASPARATPGADRPQRPKPSGRRPKAAKKEPRVVESVAGDDGEDEWVTIGERGEQEAPRPARGEKKQGEKKEGGGRRSRGRRKKGSPRSEEPQPAQTEVVVPEQATRGEAEERVAAWFTRVFELAGFDLVVRTSESDENLDVTLYGRDIGLLQQSGGELLDSLQVLANKALAGREMEKRIELDVEAFKKEREERISRKALELADEVRREGKVRTMRSMTPIERRIVHVTLRDEEGVTTESRGRGFHKRVAILPDDGSSEIEPEELATHSS